MACIWNNMNSKSNKSGFTLAELLIAIALMGIIVGALDQVTARILSAYSAVQASQDIDPQARYALERMVTFVQETDYIVAPDTTSSMNVLTVSERLSDQYNNAIPPTLPIYSAGGDGLPDADTNKDGLIISYELLTLDVAPGGAGWAAGDTLTGATSTKTCKIVEVLTTKTYTVKDRTGAFTLGEIISNGSATADQGAAYPTFTPAPAAELITFRLDKNDLKEKMPDYKTLQSGDSKAETIICEHVTAFSCRRLSPGIVEITLTLQQGTKAVTLRTTAKARWVD
jgi:prepilin-type N-terminal cleavage/methylation domain-containing protein